MRGLTISTLSHANALAAVTNGRVTKNTPNKNSAKRNIKQELSDDGFASAINSFTTGEDLSFMSEHTGLISYDAAHDDEFGLNGYV